MQLFDQPEPLVSVGGRPTTTIAPQALAIMNNPQIREYAKAFAKKLRAEKGESLEAAIGRGYRTAVGREPTAEETADETAFIAAQQTTYAEQKNADGEVLALADF